MLQILLFACGIRNRRRRAGTMKTGTREKLFAMKRILSEFTPTIKFDSKNGTAYTGQGNTGMGRYVDAVMYYKAVNHLNGHVTSPISWESQSANQYRKPA